MGGAGQQGSGEPGGGPEEGGAGDLRELEAAGELTGVRG